MAGEYDDLGFVALQPPGSEEDDLGFVANEKPVVASAPTVPKEPSFMGGVGESISKRAGNIGKEWSEFDPNRYAFTQIGGKALNTAGEVAGLGLDVIGEGVKSIYKSAIPEDVRGFITDRTDRVIRGMEGAPAIPRGVVTLGDIYRGAQEMFPEGMKNVESAVNIAGVIPIVKGITSTGKLASEGVETIAKYVRTPEAIDRAISEEVKKGFQKGIKPTIVGKSDAAKTERFYDKATVATKDIVEANPEALPQTVEEMSQRGRQVKKDLWERSSTMAREAGDEGATVSLAPLRQDLTEVVNAPNVRKAAKDAAQKVLDEISAYDDVIPPPIAEDLLASLNSDTRNFWKNPDWNKLNDPLFKERAAGILRKLTDKAVEDYQGPGWQDLRNRYGAQTAIEKGVTDRANIVARQNIKGFFDLADVFATGEFIAGLATFNPSMIIKGGAMKLAEKYVKHLNSSDRIVRDMFSNVGKQMGKEVIPAPPLAEYLRPTGSVPVTPFPGGPDAAKSPFNPRVVADYNRINSRLALPEQTNPNAFFQMREPTSMIDYGEELPSRYPGYRRSWRME